MSKKSIIIISLVLIEISSLFLMYKSFNNKNTVLDDVIVKEKDKKELFAIMVEGNDGEYTESTSNSWPSNMIYNEELSGCIDIRGNKIENALSFENNMATLNTNTTAYCYLYFDMKVTPIREKVISDYTNNNGVSLLSETSSDTYPVYYYTGNITNNNIIYADKCWKMVRTTDTGGVKLIYNGEVNYNYSEVNNIEESGYNVSTNTPTDTPFTFNSSTNEWTSGIAGLDSTTNAIEFTVTTAGNYVLAYDVSSEEDYDEASFYKNGTALKSDVSGTTSGTIDLEGLTTSDVIKVTYTKDSSSARGSDAVSFSIGTPVGEKTKSCNNSRTATHIETSFTAFNSSYNSPAYVGYMYNKVYTYSEKDLSFDTTEYVYGNSVSWDGEKYTLVNTTSGTWSSKYSSLSNNHYTCWSTGTTCTEVYYIYYGSSSDAKYSDAYYITLTNGKTVEDALNEMLYNEDVNTTNSTIKTKIDSWYESNIKDLTDNNGKLYSSYLENTIYCNNRAMSNQSTNGWNPDGGSLSTYMYFNYNTLNCENTRDQFTLKTSAGGTAGYGNNALDYPVGLLTYKEANLARDGSSTNYLNNSSYYWLLSPYFFAN